MVNRVNDSKMYLVSSRAWQAHFQNYQKLKQSTVLHSACIQDGYPAEDVSLFRNNTSIADRLKTLEIQN